jgi:hypothetical protein
VRVVAVGGLCEEEATEVNEAFAAQAPAVLKARDWDDCERRLSVNDSGISPG